MINCLYPGGSVENLAYIRRSVKIELGSLTDQQPTAIHTVRPWVADELPMAFEDWKCEVVALDISRTFWEKLTILHCEFHRPAKDPMPDRYARHYSDVARLLGHPQAKNFLEDKDLAVRVAEWKKKLFYRAWASYDTAKHGSIKLVPPNDRLSDLKKDYVAMRPFFLSEPQTFEEVIAALEKAEAQINA